MLDTVNSLLYDPPSLLALFFGVICGLLFIVLLRYLRMFYNYAEKENSEGTIIVPGIHTGDVSRYIDIDLPRSYNEEGGIAYTYNFWVVISSKNKGAKASHLFNKGSPQSGITLESPGVSITDGNTMNISLDIIGDEKKPEITMSNLPYDRWFMITLIFQNNTLEIYKNSHLVHGLELRDRIPKLNNGGIYLTYNNSESQFKGYLGSLRYFNFAIDQDKIYSLLEERIEGTGCTADFPFPKV